MQLPETVDQGIFRAYDIRGVVGEGMNAELVYGVGRAFATEARLKGQERVIVGFDGRESSQPFQKAMCQGLCDGGVDVINIGMVPSPVLYYATNILDSQSGVMITGSHNPSNYNGIKMVLAGKTINTDAIQTLYRRISERDLSEGTGVVSHDDVVERYIDDITNRISLKRPLKVVVDAGNGVGALTCAKLYRKLGCEVVELFCDVDGRFPNHHPDPTVIENLQSLIASVKEHGADIGLGFDGDADRVGVITNEGSIIWPDRFLMPLAKDVLERHPGAPIAFDVKCTNNLAKVIRGAGGEPVMHRTGHSILKAKMFEINAPMAGELSGHIFYQDNWYGFDDGVYVGARLLDVVAKQDLTTEQLFGSLPDNINTPELKVYVDEDEKFVLVERLIEKMQFDDAAVSTIDGLRVDWDDKWFLVRASNTTPCLTIRFEAKTQEKLEEVQALVQAALAELDSDLTFPW